MLSARMWSCRWRSRPRTLTLLDTMSMNIYTGIVKEGAGRAKQLGFPTVNVPLEDADPSGVYVAEVEVKGKKYIAAAFADQKRKLLEAHILDFSGDLSGQEITITLLKKIRESKEFSDDTLLRAAIAQDTKKVREFSKNI